MIMKAIRTAVFIGAILLGVAATATVSAWSGKYTGLHETAVQPDDTMVWDQRAWVYWRNHTDTSVQLNWTSHRVRYISGDPDSLTFTGHHIVADGEDNKYVDENASSFELEYGEAWHENWEYGGGRGNNQYITVQKASGSVVAYMISKESEFHKLTQEIVFYNDDDGDPEICMRRYPATNQTITGRPATCPS